MLFSHTDELEIPELANAETDLPENLQDNDATPPVKTQLSQSHLPPEETSVASAEHPPCPRVKARDATLQACAGDLLYVRLLGAHYIIYRVYQYWEHQNPVEHLDGGIVEDIQWQVQWKNLFLCRPNATKHLPGKLRRDLLESCL